MNSLIVFSALVAAAQAGVVTGPGLLAAGLPVFHGNYAPGAFYGAGVYGTGVRHAPYNLGLNLVTPKNVDKIADVAVLTPGVAAVPGPLVAAGPALPYDFPSSQYQAQDEFGNVNYGYTNVNSAKQETGNVYGGVAGSYSYVDANGIPQRTDYIADALGFRVTSATNLPIAPVFTGEAPIDTGVAPEAVKDTPEVSAAKAEFQAAFDEAASREKRSTDLSIAPLKYAASFPAITGFPAYGTYGTYGLGLGYAPNYFNYGYNNLAISGYPGYLGYGLNNAAYTTVGASIPATREAIVTRVKLNPGHAESYRVD